MNAAERAHRVGPYPYYGATGQVGWIDGYRMDGEYVLLGEDGAPFLDPLKSKAYLVSGKSWVNNHAHVLHGIDGLTDNRYLMYALNAVDYRSFVNGTTRLKLTQAAMKQIPIYLPPLAEQRRIVAKIEELFSRLDAGVAALLRVRANLKRYRRAVLQAAVEGRLTEAWRAEHPDVELASALLERILEERRRRWEEAELAKYEKAGKTPPKGWRGKYKEPVGPDSRDVPDLPAGWIWANVQELAEIQSGIQKQPSRTPRNNAYPYLRVANVHRARLDLSEIASMELFDGELERLRLLPGDLLIVEGNGSRSEIGRSALWKGAIENCVHQNHIIRVRPIHVYPEYLDFYWNSPQGNLRVMNVAASTSGLYTLSVSKVAGLPVPLPPVAEEAEIVTEVERRLSVISVVEVEVENNLKRAARLRQAILKRTFEGKLVEQDPTDEPASVLLERIRQERGSDAGGTTRKGKAKNPKPQDMMTPLFAYAGDEEDR